MSEPVSPIKKWSCCSLASTILALSRSIRNGPFQRPTLKRSFPTEVYEINSSISLHAGIIHSDSIESSFPSVSGRIRHTWFPFMIFRSRL